MIFLTTGTTHAFDRLVRAVDRALERGLIRDEVFAQIGYGTYRPRRMRCVQTLVKQEFDECVARASAIVSHAGMGILTAAIELGKPALVMPRLKRYGEAVNDHQAAIAEEFSRQGHVLAARDEGELFKKLGELARFRPTLRRASPEKVAARITRFLESVTVRR